MAHSDAPRKSVTLHAEIADILRDEGRWMTTTDIAAAVNRRARYRKRDGTPVTAYQIHGRTKNYERLFARQGSQVRLKEGEPMEMKSVEGETAQGSCGLETIDVAPTRSPPLSKIAGQPARTPCLDRAPVRR